MKHVLVALSTFSLLVGAPGVASAACGFNCGMNTSVISQVPIRGLHLQGIPNPENVTVVPRSVRLGKDPVTDFKVRDRCRGRFPRITSRGPLDLQVSRGQLTAVGVTRRWFPIFFWGDCMKRAEFDVGVPDTSERPYVPGESYVTKTMTVRIDDQSVTPSWQADNAARVWVPAYRLLYASKGGTPSENLCPDDDSMIEDWQGLDPAMDGANAPGPVPPGFTSRSPSGTPGYALIVQGETYDDETGDPLVRRDRMWFNFACAGAALSKMRLLGVDPAEENPKGLTTATLKMITAKYRGRWSGTKTGTPIHWVRPQIGTAYLGAPSRDRIGPREAWWTPKGAYCADHFRIWHANFQRGNTPIAQPDPLVEPKAGWLHKGEGEERDGLALTPCGEQGDDAAPPDVHWITHTVDHITVGH